MSRDTEKFHPMPLRAGRSGAAGSGWALAARARRFCRRRAGRRLPARLRAALAARPCAHRAARSGRGAQGRRRAPGAHRQLILPPAASAIFPASSRSRAATATSAPRRRGRFWPRASSAMPASPWLLSSPTAWAKRATPPSASSSITPSCPPSPTPPWRQCRARRNYGPKWRATPCSIGRRAT